MTKLQNIFENKRKLEFSDLELHTVLLTLSHIQQLAVDDFENIKEKYGKLQNMKIKQRG